MMSTSVYKISFRCDCCGYGCGQAKSSIIIKRHHTCDVDHFYFTEAHDQHGNPGETVKGWPHAYGTEFLDALKQLVAEYPEEELTEQEQKIVFE